MTKWQLSGHKSYACTHDASGNRIEVQHPDSINDYFAWDPRGQMVLATVGGSVVTMTYRE